MDCCKKNEKACPEEREELNLDCMEKVTGGTDENNGSNEPKSDTGKNEPGILTPEI